MTKRCKYTAIEKYNMIKPILLNEASYHFISKKYEVSTSSLTRWIHNYNSKGIAGLKESRTWSKYSEEFKLEAVRTVFSGEKNVNEATTFFEISNSSVLRQWISLYNNGRKLKATTKGSGISTMNQGRKTTFKERIEIAQFTIANQLNYQLAIQNYQVSYQQVYSWVKKYQALGSDGLKDMRGRSTAPMELTETEELKLKIKELEARNEYLEMENDYAKKLQEIRQKPPR